MQNLRIIFAAMLFGLLCSCNDPAVGGKLDAAEAIMEQHPDSALTILQTINGAKLYGEPRARHALLLSQAYDKNYILLTSDSLISIATTYYNTSVDLRRRMLSYLYRGNIYLNGESYGLSLYYLLNAYDIAKDLNDTYNLSRIESSIARIYNNFNSFDAYEWDLLALEHAKQCKKKEWLINTYTNLGEELMGALRFDEAMEYADSAINLSPQPNPRAQEIKFLSYFWVDDHVKADSIYNILSKIDYDMSVNVVDALKHNDIKRNNSTSKDELITYQRAVIDEQNEYIKAVTTNSLSEFRNKYENEKTERMQTEIHHKRTALILTSIICGLAIICLISLIIIRHKTVLTKQLKQDGEYQLLMNDYTHLQSAQRVTQLKNEELNKNIEEISQKYADNIHKFNQLKLQASLVFLKEYSWIEQFGDSYLDSTLRANQAKNNLSKLIETRLSLSNPTVLLSEIDAQLQKNDPQLHIEIDRLCLNKTEKGLLYLFIIGVSTRVICLITGKSPSAIYNAKSRIKSQLQKIDSPLASHIIDIF